MQFEDFHETPESAIKYSKCYDASAELALYSYFEAKQVFEGAHRVVDLGCGTGASMLLASRLCPQAKITTVDPRKQPFPEIVQQVEGKHQQHFAEPASRFLERSGKPFDVCFVVKAPQAIRTQDCRNLARHLSEGGFVLQIVRWTQLSRQNFDKVKTHSF